MAAPLLLTSGVARCEAVFYGCRSSSVCLFLRHSDSNLVMMGGLCCCMVGLIVKEQDRQHHYFSLVVQWGVKQCFAVVGQVQFICLFYAIASVFQ